MNSFNPSGFLEGTDALNEALSDIQIDQLESFRKKFAEEYSLIEDETQKQAARNYYQSVISGMIPQSLSKQSASDYLDKVASETGLVGMHFESEQYRLLKSALGSKNGTQLVMRILADPSLAEMSVEELVDMIQNTRAQIELQVNEQGIKNAISYIQEMGTNTDAIKQFETGLGSGTATLDDFLGILDKYPEIAGNAEDSINDLIQTIDFGGRLEDIQEVRDILSELKVKDLRDTLDQIEGDEKLESDEQKLLMKRAAFAKADLSGITSAEAAKIVDEFADGDAYLIRMAGSANALEREAAALAAGMGIDFDRAFQIVENRAEQTAVSAVQSFQSASNEIASFSEKAMSGQATSEDVFGLLETFPELFDKTDVLGEAFSQLSLSGAITDASTLQTILTEISQIRLKDMLQTNGITDYKVIQGLANTLDFSSKSVDSSMQNAYNTLSKSFTGLENIDLSTAEGRNIMGNIQFTINAVGGIDHLLPDQIPVHRPV